MGKRTSPVTNEPLAHLHLAPAHAVKSLITEFVDECRELGVALDDDA